MTKQARGIGRCCRLMLALAMLLPLCAVGPRPAARAAGDTITVTPAVIPLSDPEIVNPMRGFYRWYGNEPIPQPRSSYDQYARYGWRQLEPERGVYDFSAIEQALQTARSDGARFAFRVMSVNEFTSPVEVPSYLMREAGGSYCTYNGTRLWVPNWDSPAFLARAQALMQALGARFDGDARLAYYDLGIYGHWGEWHNGGLCTPPASDATKRALVDMQIDAFPHTRTLMNSGGAEVDAFVYALDKSPRVGVRVDSLCDPWFDQQFTVSSAKLAAMQERWKTAPLVSEFVGDNPTNISQCSQQAQTWHIASIANSHVNWSSYSADQQSQLLLLGKQTGYRFVLNTLTYSATVTTNAQFTVTSQWSNVGVTPAYEPFQVFFALQPQGQATIVWRQASQLDLQQLLPTSQPSQVVDQLYLPERLPPGAYTLSLSVCDSQEYRAPLLLGSAGADAEGRYLLGDITVQQGAPGYAVFLPLVDRSTNTSGTGRWC